MKKTIYIIFTDEVDTMHFYFLHNKIEVLEIFNHILGSYIKIETDATDIYLLFHIFPEIDDICEVIPIDHYPKENPVQ